MKYLLRSRVSVLLTVLVAAGSTLTGCAQTRTEGAASPAFALNHLKARAASVSSVDYDDKLRDWLPNQLFRIDGGVPRPLGHGVVSGEVVDAEPGRAYKVDGDADTGSEVPYGTPDALWRTIDVTLAVKDGWRTVGGSDTIRFGLSISGTVSPEDFMRSVEALDSAIVVLARQGFFAYDAELYGVGRNGSLIGVVDQGRISLPALDTEAAEGYVADTPTLEALREASTTSPPEIVIKQGVRQ